MEKFIASLVLGMGLIMSAPLTASTQTVAPCVLDGTKLTCLTGEERNRRERDARYHAALAVPATRNLFADPVASLNTFSTEWDRELFRRSLERARLGAMRHMRRQYALHKAFRISDAEIHRQMAAHEQMLATYKDGYWFYKELIWNRR